MYSCLKESRIPIPEHFKLVQELCNGKRTCKVQACDSFWSVSLDCPDTSMLWIHYRCNGEVRRVKRKYDKVRKISVCDTGSTTSVTNNNGTTPTETTPFGKTITPDRRTTITHIKTTTSTSIPSCNPKTDSIQEGKLIQRDVVKGHEVTIDCKGGCIEIIKVQLVE